MPIQQKLSLQLAHMCITHSCTHLHTELQPCHGRHGGPAAGHAFEVCPEVPKDALQDAVQEALQVWGGGGRCFLENLGILVLSGL